MGERMMSFPIDFSRFEVEITNRCNIKCPRCARTTFIEEFPTLWRDEDLLLEDFVKFIEPVIDQIDTIQFKGAHGDPIFHPKFIQWISWCKENNKRVMINTNGQAGKNLWSRLVDLLDKSDRVTLGIDGIPTNFMQYRIGAKWNNIVTCVEHLKNKCYLEWQYIVFNFNYNNIQEAEELSKEMGFDSFFVMNTGRWDGKDDPYKPPVLDNSLITEGDKTYDLYSNISNLDNITDIDPQCLREPKHYISADSYYIPCCHIADYRWRLISPWSRLFNIKNHTILDVINSEISNNFFSSLESHNYCKINCGKC